MDEIIDKLNNLTINENDDMEQDIKDIIIGIDSLSINSEVKTQLNDILLNVIHNMLTKARCICLYANILPKYIK